MGESVLIDGNETKWFWPEYYEEFPYFSDNSVRPGCHPRKLVHSERKEKAVILVHGLTDSPYYMEAVAEYFHFSLGYDVYLPLLQCHGLKNPEKMAGVSLDEWKKNVRFAVQTAAEGAGKVSIGGLSTGGALGFYLGCSEPEVTGDIYLFSAALGLFGGPFGLFGGLVEFLLRLEFSRLLDNGKFLVGKHPYRYNRVPLNSAGELSKLIQEIDMMLALSEREMEPKRVFAAWSESDRVINCRKIESLKEIVWIDAFAPYPIPKSAGVDHACVVLSEPIYAIGSQQGDKPIEAVNPLFEEMMQAMSSFEAGN